MKFLFVFLVLTFAVSSSFASLKSKGKTHLSLSKTDSSAKITVDEGFHFNTEAPTYMELNKAKLAPTLASDKQLLFRWKGHLSAGAKIQYYVCDDAKTVCEPHTEKLSETGDLTDTKSISTMTAKNSGIEKDEEGFIVNNLKAALQVAQEKKSLVLIDFTASWCPACIRLIHESFNTSKFKAAATNYVLAKIDVDREDNQSLLEKYSIRAFPTMVITNSKGFEIDRILDFLPAEPLAQRLNNINISLPLPIEELKKKALAGDKAAALSMGKNAFRAQQTKECLDWFTKSEQKPIEYYMCLISQSDDAAPETHAQDLNKAIEAFPNSFYSIDWHLQLVELFKNAASYAESNNKLLSNAESIVQKWLTTPELTQQAMANNELIELKDLVIPELYYYLGTIYEAQNKKNEPINNLNLRFKKLWS